jgi:hypothetical protein
VGCEEQQGPCNVEPYDVNTTQSRDSRVAALHASRWILIFQDFRISGSRAFTSNAVAVSVCAACNVLSMAIPMVQPLQNPTCCSRRLRGARFSTAAMRWASVRVEGRQGCVAHAHTVQRFTSGISSTVMYSLQPVVLNCCTMSAPNVTGKSQQAAMLPQRGIALARECHCVTPCETATLLQWHAQKSPPYMGLLRTSAAHGHDRDAEHASSSATAWRIGTPLAHELCQHAELAAATAAATASSCALDYASHIHTAKAVASLHSRSACMWLRCCIKNNFLLRCCTAHTHKL